MSRKPLLSYEDIQLERPLSGLPFYERDEDVDKIEYIEIVYLYRWLIVALFFVSGFANALVLLSWAPITDKANDYWDNIGITAINLLNVIFPIMYIPGTLLALRISEKNKLKNIIVSGGVLSTIGCLIRVVGAFLRDKGLGAIGSYILVFLGTAMVGLAQPFYLNTPAKIATTWFPVDQRDLAMTLCSLANIFGSAVGSYIPPLLITSDAGDTVKNGIEYLLILQFSVSASALLMVIFFFRSEPASAPSRAAQSKNSGSAITMIVEVRNLFKNMEYCKLFFAFTVVLGNLNALAALINQIPGDYSNGEIGLTGAMLIICGFSGVLLTGFLLSYTMSYRTIVKGSYFLAVISWVFFLSNCREGHFNLFIISAALLGFLTMPISENFLLSYLYIR
jgi:MFS transporter, FLVCR family, MFS-domain-containing protein 7